MKKTNNKLILGIETSCDDTSLCLLEGQVYKNQINYNRPNVIELLQFSQTKILEKWGGVVPEVAARNHLVKLPILLNALLKSTQIKLEQIDLVAVTAMPGLLGPLLTGVNFAKSISLFQQKPIIPINHLYAHLEAIHLTETVSYPYLGLLVSGGHSLYILVKGPKEFILLGNTIDDAAGEAFDKGGKLLNLSYPAGPIIDKIAKNGDIEKYQFPIGLKNSKDCNLSYSGTKTALKVFLENNDDLKYDENKYNSNDLYKTKFQDLCASYQNSIVQALKLKMKYAIQEAEKKHGLNNLPIVVGGGVAANSALRNVLQDKFQNIFFVKPKYCTDNSAMIANYALRTFDDFIEYPNCLKIDARNRFFKKNQK